MTTKEEVLEEMKNHDWTFEWSDDGKKWAKGSAHKTKIIMLAKQAGMTRDEIMDVVIKRFGTSDPVTEQWEDTCSRYEAPEKNA